MSLHHVRGDPPSDHPPAGGVTVDPAACIRRHERVQLRAENLPPVRPDGGDLIEIEAAGIVVLVEMRRRLEGPPAHHLPLGGDLGNLPGVVEAVEIMPLRVQADIALQTPGIETGKDHPVDPAMPAQILRSPADQALHPGRFVAVDPGGEIKGGPLRIGRRGFQDNQWVAAGLGVDAEGEFRKGHREAQPPLQQEAVVADLVGENGFQSR